MDLKRSIRPLLRWWWLLVAATLVATAFSYVAIRRQPPVYRARATLMVGSAIEDPNPSGNELLLTQRLATTYADIARRKPIRRATQTALGLSWLPEYTVRVVPNTQLLEITVVDTDPQRAQAVANELANQLIRQSPTGPDPEEQQRQAFINQQLDDLEVSITETRAEIIKAQEELARAFSARQIADLQAQITALQNKLNTLQSNYAALLANTQRGAINTIRVIEPASLPTRPIGPPKTTTILLAAAIGFILAAGGAYLLDYLDDTLKSSDDVKRLLGLSLLGSIPRVKPFPQEEPLILTTNGRSPLTEAYRMLRTNLQFVGIDHPIRLLLITSSAPTEGKSVTVANLGIILAQSGRRVILLDADLHRPQLHRLFRSHNHVGLTTALLKDPPDLETVLLETEIPGLWILPSGPPPPNPAELLDSARMERLLVELQTRADIVLIDTPPVTALADTAILATRVDGVLLVLEAGRTRQAVARQALDILAQVNARVIGALLNQVPVWRMGYYPYDQANGQPKESTSPRAEPKASSGSEAATPIPPSMES